MFQQITYIDGHLNFISVTCSPHNAKTTIGRYQCTNRPIPIIGNWPIPIIGASLYSTIKTYNVLCQKHPSPLLDNIWVMVIVWLRGNIIRTALCRIVWHNVHSQQHTYMSTSYWSNDLICHTEGFMLCIYGGCLELYYCNMMEWFW